MAEPNPAHHQITDLFTKQHASNERLDYFMCSVAGALFAYMGQTFAPEKLHIVTNISIILALLILSLSFYCAYRRIQTQNADTRGNKMEVEICNLLKTIFERISQFESMATQRPDLQLNITNEMGEPYTIERLKMEKLQKEQELKIIREDTETDRTSHLSYGIWRDRLLLCGFIGLLAAKVFQWLMW